MYAASTHAVACARLEGWGGLRPCRHASRRIAAKGCDAPQHEGSGWGPYELISFVESVSNPQPPAAG
jgi:hypothetical protein